MEWKIWRLVGDLLKTNGSKERERERERGTEIKPA